MTEYVLGFSFCSDYALFRRVLLIRKTKPEWQAGKLNGIGGKIEVGDPNPHWAMSREFKEECGLATLPSAWMRFAILEFSDARVHCFVTHWSWKEFKQARSTTEEEIVHFEIDEQWFDKLDDAQALPNIHWLVPMALKAWFSRGSFCPTVLKISEGIENTHVDVSMP